MNNKEAFNIASKFILWIIMVYMWVSGNVVIALILTASAIGDILIFVRDYKRYKKFGGEEWE